MNTLNDIPKFKQKYTKEPLDVPFKLNFNQNIDVKEFQINLNHIKVSNKKGELLNLNETYKTEFPDEIEIKEKVKKLLDLV